MAPRTSLAEPFDDVSASVARVCGYVDDNLVSIGTGFLVHRDGYVVTAKHVIDDATRIEIVPEKWKHPIPAVWHKTNKDDMAILRVDYASLDENFLVRFVPARILPRHKHVLAGNEVGIAGYAWGMDHKDDSTLFVFKRGVALNIMHPPIGTGLLYYLDGTAIAGMSGGPVFSLEDGCVVGVLIGTQPEDYFEFRSEAKLVRVPSPEHLTVALQSHYIHTGLSACGVQL